MLWTVSHTQFQERQRPSVKRHSEINMKVTTEEQKDDLSKHQEQKEEKKGDRHDPQRGRAAGAEG